MLKEKIQLFIVILTFQNFFGDLLLVLTQIQIDNKPNQPKPKKTMTIYGRHKLQMLLIFVDFSTDFVDPKLLYIEDLEAAGDYRVCLFAFCCHVFWDN